MIYHPNTSPSYFDIPCLRYIIMYGIFGTSQKYHLRIFWKLYDGRYITLLYWSDWYHEYIRVIVDTFLLPRYMIYQKWCIKLTPKKVILILSRFYSEIKYFYWHPIWVPRRHSSMNKLWTEFWSKNFDQNKRSNLFIYSMGRLSRIQSAL